MLRVLDRKLRGVGLKVIYDNGPYFRKLALSITFSAFTNSLIFHSLNTMPLFVWFFFSMILNDSRLRQFALLLEYIRQHLVLLNTALPHSKPRKLEILAEAHCKLLELSRILNDTYSFYILLIITDKLFNILAAAYFVLNQYLKSFSNGWDSLETSTLTIYVLHGVNYFHSVWHLTTQCAQTMREVTAIFIYIKYYI
jgi:hypothetical protein